MVIIYQVCFDSVKQSQLEMEIFGRSCLIGASFCLSCVRMSSKHRYVFIKLEKDPHFTRTTFSRLEKCAFFRNFSYSFFFFLFTSDDSLRAALASVKKSSTMRKAKSSLYKGSDSISLYHDPHRECLRFCERVVGLS